MNDLVEIVVELAKSAAVARFRKLEVEGEEHPDRSWQRVTCHLNREDVPWAAVPLIYALSVMSFADGRPRGVSEIEYVENDEWTVADVIARLQLGRGRLVFDADYVRGRMMKTRVTIGSDGSFVIETRNRHEMALRWLDQIRGKKHIRLAAVRSTAKGDQRPD